MPRPRPGARSFVILSLSLLLPVLWGGCASTVRYSSAPAVAPAADPEKQRTGPAVPGPESIDKTEDAVAEIPENEIARKANSFLGTPYHYGGTTRAGLDCSGLVCLVFRQAGDMVLPHSSKKLHKLGRKISLAQARPGDLLFFSTGIWSGIDHVGVYVGNGRFIHASTKLGVTESSLDDTYYRSRFVEARRLLK